MKLKFICLFLALGLSLIYSHAVLDPALLPKFIALSILIIALAIVDFFSNEKEQITLRTIFQPINLAYAGYLFFNIISLLNANVFSEWAFDVMKISLEFVFLLKLQSILHKHYNRIQNISLAITVFAFTVCGIGFVEIFRFIHNTSQVKTEDIYLFSSTIAHKNLFSSALFIAIPFSIISLSIHSNNWIKVVAIITIISSLLIIILLETRAVWVATVLSFIIFSIIFVWFFFKKNYFKNISKKKVIGITLSLIFLAMSAGVIIYTRTQNNLSFKERFSSTLNFSDFKNNPTLNTYNLRYKLWTKSWQMFKDNPLVGVGAGNWEVHFPAYGLGDMEDETSKGTEHYQRPHNDFIWVLCETGMGGLLCYLGLFLIAVLQIIQNINKIISRQSLIQLYCLLFLFIGYGIVSFCDFPKERIEHSIIFCVALSFVITICTPSETALNSKTKKITWYLIALPAGVLALVVGAYRAYGEAHTFKIYAAQTTGNWSMMENEAKKAQSSFYRLDPFSAPLYWYQGVAAYSKNNIDEAFDDFTKAYALHPNHVHVLNNLASCYVQKGDYNKAIELYLRAISITPRFFESILNLSAVYFNQHNFDAAYSNILKMPPDKNDERYRLFTTAIVRAKINVLFTNENNPELRKYINTLQTNDALLLDLYMAARWDGVPLKSAVESASLKFNN